MNREMAKTMVLAAFALAVVPGTWQARAPDAKNRTKAIRNRSICS
jgi:hypothetical protein